MTESPGSKDESQIAVHWREEEYSTRRRAFVAQANAHDPAIFERFAEDRISRTASPSTPTC